VLVGAVEERLKVILWRVALEVGAEIIEVEVMPDRIHLLVEIPPAVALWELMRVAKGRACRLLRAEFAALRLLGCLWSPSWFCSTVGGASLEVVRRYVENQKRAG
jgi:REP-associated tyrosine transposase